MNDWERVTDAVRLYQESQTGWGRKGTRRQSQLGLAVRRLVAGWLRNGEREVAFVVFSGGNLWGRSRPDPRAADIRITRAIRHDVAATALVLLHEAVHLVIDGSEVDEEMQCRQMQLLLYEELVTPGLAFTDHAGARQRAQVLDNSDYDLYLRKQQAAHSHGQLIDYVLRVEDDDPHGTNYADSLTAGWVRAHFDDWGGVANRWATSLGHYVRVLVPAADDLADAQLILQCLERVKEHEGYWNEVTRVAGGAAVITRLVRTLLRTFHDQGRAEAVSRTRAIAAARSVVLP